MTTNVEKTHKNIYTGQVIAIKKHKVVINAFLKCLYYIDINDFTEEELKTLLGSEIRVYITSLDNCKNKEKAAYYKKAKYEILWSKIVEYKAKNQLIEGTILNATKGGYSVQISIDNITINAFMPMSHAPSSEELVQKYVNTFKIIGTNKIHKNIVISRKEVLLSEISLKNKENNTQMEEGASVFGIIKNMSPQGMSVNTGLNSEYSFYIPASLATYRHETLLSLFSQGQTIEASVHEVIELDKKVILRLIDINENPFIKYQEENTIEIFPIKIVHENTDNYIVICKTSDNLLCKMTKSNNLLPLETITAAIEQKISIEARILAVNADHRYIFCTTFRSPQEIWSEFTEEYEADQNKVFEFKAKNKSKFMLFASYKKINAIIPINLIHYKNTLEEFNKIQSGDTIRATVISINQERQEVLCSTKAIYQDEANEVFEQIIQKKTVMCTTQYVFTNTKRVICVEGALDVVLNTSKMSPKKLKLMDEDKPFELMIKAYDKSILHIELVSSAAELSANVYPSHTENLSAAIDAAVSAIQDIE